MQLCEHVKKKESNFLLIYYDHWLKSKVACFVTAQPFTNNN